MEAQKEYRKDGKGKLWVYLNEYLTEFQLNGEL